MTSVEEIRDLANQIAETAETAEKQYAQATSMYEQYTETQDKLRDLTLRFNTLSQQIAKPVADKTSAAGSAA